MNDHQGSLERNESVDGEIGALAAQQYGVVSLAQACAAGMTARQIHARVGAGRWELVLPRVYRIVGAVQSDQQSAMAAVMWAGSGALASHATAGRLWGLDGMRAPKVEVWVPAGRSPRLSAVTVHRGTRLDRADRTVLGSVPLTTPVRTLIDMAGRLEDDRLLAVMEQVFRQELGTPERLSARLRSLRSSGRPGLGRLEALLDRRGFGGPLESRLEARVWLLLQRSGVPLPVRQHWVAVASGRYRLDFAWPESRVGLECDSWEYHGDRARFGKERARYAELAALRWRIVPITWEACTTQPERVLGWIRAAVSTPA
jgi:very-short-patch-repair endonuclease